MTGVYTRPLDSHNSPDLGLKSLVRKKTLPLALHNHLALGLASLMGNNEFANELFMSDKFSYLLLY